MATPEEEKKKKNSFGDAAAAAQNLGTTLVGSPRSQTGFASQTQAYVAGAQAANPQPNVMAIDPPGVMARPKPMGPPAALDAGPMVVKPGDFTSKLQTSPPAQAEPPSDYARQMGQVAGFFGDLGKHVVSAPGYGFNREAAAPTTPTTPQVATAGMAPSMAGPGRGVINPPLVDPMAPLPRAQQAPAPMAPTPAGAITRIDQPWQSPLFTNMPADSASNTAMLARGFQPTAQSQGAAQALSDRYGAEIGGINAKAQYDAEVAAAQQANQANLAVSRQIERGMQRDALIKQAGQTNSRSRATALLQAANSMDSTDQRGAEVAGSQAMEGKRLDQAATQFGFNSKLAREKQALETRKSDAEIGGVNADTQVKGFTARAAERLAKLQEQYMAAKPEDQPALAKQIQALAGKSDKPQMHVVNRPDTMDERTGQKLGGGQSMVVQGADGVFRELPVGASQQTQRPIGTVSDVGGKKAVWDGSKWIEK